MLKNIIKILFTTVLGKILGFLKIVLLIQFYGTNALTDALIIVISMYWFWSNIIVYSLFSVSLIPNLARTKSQKFQIFKTLRTLYSVNSISIIGFILILILNKNIVFLFAPIENEDFLLYSNILILIMSPLLFLIPSTEIFTILNQYNNRMITSSINLTIWNLFQTLVIIICFYYITDKQYVVYLFGIFTIFSYIVTSYIQIKASKFFDYYSIKNLVCISYKSSINNILKNYKIFLSVLLTQLNVYIDNYFIASLSSGYISKYNIIIKVPELIQSLLISALAVVFFNKIVNEKSESKTIFIKFFLYLLPIIIIGIILVNSIGVDFLYLIYSKSAFIGLEYNNIKIILNLIVLNVFLMILIALLVKLYIAKNSTTVLLGASFINIIINLFGNYFLIIEYGLLGVSLSTLLASYILLCILLIYEFKLKIIYIFLLIFIIPYLNYILWSF